MFRRGQQVLLWGVFEERKTRLEFMLRKLGLKVCPQPSREVDCVILGQAQAAPALPETYPCIPEQQALAFLQQQQMLESSAPSRSIQNLRLLLRHPEANNRTLGLDLMQAEMRPYCYGDLLFAYLEYRDLQVYDYLLAHASPAFIRCLRNAETLSLEDLALRLEEIQGEELAELFWEKSRQSKRQSEASHFLLKYSNQKKLRQAVLQRYVHQDGALLLHDFLVRYCAAEEFTQIQHVSSVGLQGVYFERLPEALLHLPPFTELRLNNVRYSENWQLQQLDGLYALRLRAMPLNRAIALLQQAPRSLGRISLVELTPTAADWPRLYELLAEFYQLQELNIRQCQLGELPPLQNFAQVTQVDLSNNAIALLPAYSEALCRLRYLNLYGNQLQALPEGLFEQPQLQEVILSNNSPELDDWLYAYTADYFLPNCEVKYDNVR